MWEYLKNNEFMNTFDIVKNLDFAYTTSFRLLYNHKVKEMEEYQELQNEIERDYHNGVMDPSRLVAKIEKQVAIKKNVGAKKKIQDNMKKFEDQKKT